MNEKIKIIFRQSDFENLKNELYEETDMESMAIGFYNYSGSTNKIRILVNAILTPQPSDYFDQASGRVSLRPEFMESCFRLCEERQSHLMDIHTHPWSKDVKFSPIDDSEGLNVKIPYMRQYVPKTEIGFMVFGNTPDQIQARIIRPKWKKWKYVDEIIII